MAGKFKISDWTVDVGACELSRNGTTAKLTPRAMAVLEQLATVPGEVVTFDDFLDAHWPRSNAGPNAVHKCVSELRRAFDNGGSEVVYIETVPKRGYRLVAAVSPVGTAVEKHRKDNGGSVSKSLAVLRFRNVDGNPEHEYLATTISTALLEGLSHARDLRVIDRERAFVHSFAKGSVQRIGADLGVTHVLDGSVQIFDDRIRVTVSLYDAADSEPIYAYTQDEPIERILQVQDKTVTNVLLELAIELDAKKSVEMRDWGTRSVKAYLAAAEGEHIVRQTELRSMPFAASRLRDAIALDPGFLNAYAWLANALGTIGTQLDGSARAELLREIASLRGVIARIAPTSNELKIIQFEETRLGGGNYWARLEAQARDQIQAAGPPRRADYNYVVYADYLLTGHLFKEAEEFLDLYARYEPEDSQLDIRRAAIAAITQGPRHGIPTAERVARSFPNAPWQMSGVAMQYMLGGQYDVAERLLERLREIDPTPNQTYAYSTWLHLSVLRGDLRPGSEEFHRAAAGPGVGEFAGGLAYLMAGDVENGVRIWRRITHERREFVYRVTVHSEGYVPASVVADPRYQAYLDELGIGREWTEFLRAKVAELAPITGVMPSGPEPQAVFHPTLRTTPAS